jgi:hypothetical protein
MKSLRLGNFRSILEMLGPDGQDEAVSSDSSARSQPRRPAAFADVFTADTAREPGYVPLDRLARLYGEERPEAPQPAVWPADDAAIAAELRLGAARTGEDLRRIRRSFAMHNHPDRVPAWLRDEATRRMTIANALIDSAMRGRAKKPRLG